MLSGDSPVTVSSCQHAAGTSPWLGHKNTLKDASVTASVLHPGLAWLVHSSLTCIAGRLLLIDVSFLCSLMKGSGDTKQIKTSRGGPRSCL